MSIRFNADEVFEMAVHIEQNGVAFYQKAAAKAPEEHRDFLLSLARMEEEHERLFKGMRKALSDVERQDTTYDPYQEALQYLNELADARGGEGDPKVAEALTGDESIEEILRIAVGLEKESILFYVGLKDLVPEELGHKNIDKIIAEERKHVVQISEKLKEITQ
jgi:rubrerythrin